MSHSPFCIKESMYEIDFRHHSCYCSIYMLTFFGGGGKFTPEQELSKTSLEINIIEIDDGYGYQILNGNKLLIQQEYIPAINRRQTFRTHYDAEFVANLVRHKLINGHNPVVTISELNDLNILILKK